jgi:hypothetical protein
MSDKSQDTDTCRCCNDKPESPDIYNRPGKGALDYRIGTHQDFFRRMVARLPKMELPDKKIRPLTALKTRDLDDTAIAFLDAWAEVADVLTFYQERIANEGYLRTATERRTVLELARTIGYELGPGIAANAYLAFTVEVAPGSPGEAVVPKGTKVLSIPGQGEMPQAFETSTEIIARAEWNALRPRMTRPQVLGTEEASKEASTIYIEGLNSDLKPGGRILFVVTVTDLKDPNKKKIIPTVKTIKEAVLEEKLNRTRIELGDSPKTPEYKPYVPKTYAVPYMTVLPFNEIYVSQRIMNQAWQEKDLIAFLSFQGWSSKSVTDHINTMMAKHKAVSPMDDAQLYANQSVMGTFNRGIGKADVAAVETQSITTTLYYFKAQGGSFGHNAPLWASLPASQRSETGTVKGPIEGTVTGTVTGTVIGPIYGPITGTVAGSITGTGIEYNNKEVPYSRDWDKKGSEPSIAQDSAGKSYNEKKMDMFYFDRILSELLPGSWVILEDKESKPYLVDKVFETTRADFSLSTKVTGVVVKSPNNGDPNLEGFKMRTTTIYALSRPLTLAALPIDSPIGPNQAEVDELTLDDTVMNLQVGQVVAVKGERNDLEGVKCCEIVKLKEPVQYGGLTTLFFEEGLKNIYKRDTVTINANLAPATHGETVREILGSGRGSLANQKFVLKKPPLTYIQAASSTGRESSLAVRVNDVLWDESGQLYGLDERSESYIVRIDDDHRATVIFGDGTMGSRLPTGVENITAIYRSGIGLPGMLPADKLTLLPTRPLGIRGVTNPVPTSDAAEPEDRDSAKYNAPRTVQILSRIVSLQDFEDYSRAFPGIGKAKAISVGEGEGRFVHITVAAASAVAGGGAADKSLATHEVSQVSKQNLIDAIKETCDPTQHFKVDFYQPLFFNLTARILVNPSYNFDQVRADVENALKTAFSFERRDFGQSATAAEAIAIIQNIREVIAVDLEEFYNPFKKPVRAEVLPTIKLSRPTRATATRIIAKRIVRTPNQRFEEVLEAGLAELKGGKWTQAQLLLINPLGIDLKEMEP